MNTLPKKSLVGKNFRRLKVIKFSHKNKTTNIWECLCTCGKTTFVSTGDLTRKDSRAVSSCGCFKKELWIKARTKHGRSGRDRTYIAWINMRSRCNGCNRPDYKHYGGRGIKVCDRWNDYGKFLQDLGECPQGGSLERINVDGDYCPENCKWILKENQPKNCRTNVLILFLNKFWKSWELEQHTNVPRHSLRRWHKQGKDINKEVLRYTNKKERS